MTTDAESILTDRQAEILRYIALSIRDRQRPPAIREICAAFGISSPNGMLGHLKALQRKGMILHDPNTTRGLRLTADGWDAAGVNVLGVDPQRVADLERLIGEYVEVFADARPDLAERAKRLLNEEVMNES